MKPIGWLYLVLVLPCGWALFGGFFPLMVVFQVELKNRLNSAVSQEEAVRNCIFIWFAAWVIWLFCKWAGPLGLILPHIIHAIKAA
ncbi:MAG: hypothetical protein J0I12_11200 [Candidatus Eremiobacteraeota bacterium]|nr:hypothetical protein [Candidatus Eremiobacteraeota bacterium]